MRRNSLSMIVALLSVVAPLVVVSPGMASTLSDYTDKAVFTDTSREYGEPHIAIHPSQPEIIFAACMAHIPNTSDYDIAVGFSTDSGQTWDTELSLLPAAQGDGDDDRADPVVDWLYDSSGWHAVIVFLDEGPTQRTMLSKTSDYGTTWSTHEVYGQNSDKCWVAATKDGTGDLYAGFSIQPSSGADFEIRFTRSTDSGVNWSSPVDVTVAAQANAVEIEVGNGDDVYLAYSVYTGATTQDGEKGYVVLRSTDRGQTWPTPAVSLNVQGNFGQGWDFPPYAIKKSSQPALAVDTSLGPYRGNVYVAWTNVDPATGPDPIVPDTMDDDPNVYVVRSTDNGATFSTPIRVSAPSTLEEEFNAGLECDPCTGHLYAVWQGMDDGDVFNAPFDWTDDDAATFVGYSTDAGDTWEVIEVSDARYGNDVLSGNILQLTWRGEYLGLDARGGRAVLLWNNTEDHTVFMSDLVPSWSGTIELSCDAFVPAGTELEISPGTTIEAHGLSDLQNVGRYANKVEIVADGAISALGTDLAPVVFMLEDPPNGNDGDWGGILFRNAKGDEQVSTLQNIEMFHAEIGVEADSLAPTLYKPLIQNYASAQILLPEKTRLRENHEWNLDAPFEVQATSGAGVEFVVSGHLETIDPDELNESIGTDEYVTFTSTTNTDGDDWVGITVKGTGLVTDGVGTIDMQDARVEHASTALSLLLAGRTSPTVRPTVRDSEFRRYAEEGLLDMASDSYIYGNWFYRDDAYLGASDGLVGIHITESAALCDSNFVFWHNDRGIWVDIPSTACDSYSGTTASLTEINRNVVMGANDVSATTGSGIEVSWACGEYDVDVYGNNVQDWPENGIKIRQSADVEISCNCVRDNDIGLFHRRDKLDYTANESEYNELTENELTGNATSNVRTHKEGPDSEPSESDPTPYDTSGLCAGGNSTYCSGGGSNVLELDTSTSKNWVLGSTEGRTDFAEDNVWKDETGSILTTTTAAENTVTFVNANGQDFDLDPLDTTVPSPFCASTVTNGCSKVTDPSAPQSQSFGSRQDVEAPAEPGRGSSSLTQPSETAVPTKLALGKPRPNPSQGSVEFTVAVPRHLAGPANLSIVNVRGQRIKQLLAGQIVEGVHNYIWDGRADDGRAVSSGVYFASLSIGGSRITERIVLIP